MRLLFKIDAKNYDVNGIVWERPSVRSIIIKDNKVAMVYSQKYNYFKFPGGGLEPNESHEDALIRETREEVGLDIISSSIKAYGYVHRIQRGITTDVFIQDNFYYLCEVKNIRVEQSLDGYEAEEGFTLRFVDAKEVINVNRNESHGPKDLNMIERESSVLEMLIQEDILK